MTRRRRHAADDSSGVPQPGLSSHERRPAVGQRPARTTKGPGWAGPLSPVAQLRARRIACGERSRAVGEYLFHIGRRVASFSRSISTGGRAEIGRSPFTSVHRAWGGGREDSGARGYTPPRGRVRHAESQDRPRRDAQGRRDHGRRRRRSGPDRRGSGRVRGHGARARSGGHSPRRWRGPDVAIRSGFARSRRRSRSR